MSSGCTSPRDPRSACAPRPSVAVVASLLFGALGCKSGPARDVASGPPAEAAAHGDPLRAAAAALGGAEALRSIRSQEIVAQGERLEPGQSSEPGQRDLSMRVSAFRYRAIDDRQADRLRMEWHRDVFYPYPGKADYVVTVDKTRGFVDGKDGVFSAPKAPMLAANVTTLRKSRWLTSPDLLVAAAGADPGQVRSEPDQPYKGRPHRVVAVAIADSPRPLRLFIDAQSGVPSKIDTLEDDPIYGDALVEIELEDWRETTGAPVLRLPFKLTHKVSGHVVQTEQRASIRTSAEPPAPLELPSADGPALDANGAALGARSSQWFLRMHGYGIPHYDRHAPVAMTDVAPGVVHFGGGTHHSLIVEMKDHLIVVEAPLYEERSRAVMASAAKRWPGKPIRVVVSTHFHDDHTGGLRAYAAIGAKIVTSRASRGAVEAYLRAPHTVFPDALQTQPREVPIEVVEDKLVLGDGARTIELHRVPNTHANDMLAVYIPRDRFLFVSDIWSPGAGPEPFKVYNRELLAFIRQSKLEVERLGGTHGGIGPLEELVTAAEGK